ncbi:hypothetical protein BDR03DRAFT_1016555 [Suillus americanus]|nr:hypothetical protein BDR03DRAFT_1016555 [Suillus americanus]
MTCGSTDLPLQGVALATEGVQYFMGSVMGINNQDLVSKMEGFAVQGMTGKKCNQLAAATNPNRHKKYKSSETVEDDDSSDEEHEHGDEEQDESVDEPVDKPVHQFSAPAAAQAAGQPSTSDMDNTSGLQLPGSDFPPLSNDLDTLGFNFYIPRDSDASTSDLSVP